MLLAFRVFIGGSGNSLFSCESPERQFQGQSDDVCTSPVWVLIKVSLHMIIQDLHVSSSLLRSNALQMTLNTLCWCVSVFLFFYVCKQQNVCVFKCTYMWCFSIYLLPAVGASYCIFLQFRALCSEEQFHNNPPVIWTTDMSTNCAVVCTTPSICNMLCALL